MIKQILGKMPRAENGIKSVLEAVDSERGTAVFGLNLGEKAALIAASEGVACFVTAQNNMSSVSDLFTELGRRPVCIANAFTDFTLNKISFGENHFNKLNALFKLMTIASSGQLKTGGLLSKNAHKPDHSPSYNSIDADDVLSCYTLPAEADMLIVTPEILLERFSLGRDLVTNTISVYKGQRISRESVVDSLVRLGYRHQDSVSLIGDFAVRGSVLDVFCVNSGLPIRLQFFDDEIEEIKLFSLETGLSVKALDKTEILPNTNVFFKDKQSLIAKLKDALTGEKLSSATYTRLSEKLAQATNMVENEACGFNLGFFAPFVDTCSVLDFLPTNATVFVDEPKFVVQACTDALEQSLSAIEHFVAEGELSSKHRNAIFTIEEVKRTLENFRCVSFQAITTQNNLFSVAATFRQKTLPLIKYGQAGDLLIRDLVNFREQGFTCILCLGDNSTTVRYEKNLAREQLSAWVANTPRDIKPEQINLLPITLPRGFCFVADKLVVLGDSELKAIVPKNALSKASGTKSANEVPVEGDFVVHTIHGVGKCLGITKLASANTSRDYVVVEYKNGDKLYVPTEQLDSLSKFSGSERKPSLNTIGGQEFGRIKERVKESAKGMALDLVALYSKRETAAGYIYHHDDEMMNAFIDTFAYEETPDQMSAIRDVLRDMTKGKVMDRLICGDVGFGKTEVALRAIMLAVLNGKQVAFMAPTTILSEQHFNTCKVRFASFGIEVRSLNRFKSPLEQKQILAELKEGKVQIVCGTHRLLSQDVQFFDLGLLILDEEQRFGVADKEKIKTFKSNINVLTLSATPIPRTLHMSLSGIRDISLIESAPARRLPVQSIVTEYSDVLLAEAVKRELSRNGQVLILYNRVESIDEFASRVRVQLGESVSIQVAHGQMSKNRLEDVILEVYSGKTQVLIATTLIENGIDLPRANTLFVIDADRLGLAELYQLRGRVGRSTVLAYAYFTYKASGTLSDEAYKRLNAILEFTELGSGYKIALRDLEIRGAGNLLGREQSGAMVRVGYDMYTRLLSEAVSEIKGEKVERLRDVVIDVDIDAYIDTVFLPLQAARMRVYTLISSIKNETEAESIASQLTDLYGVLPSSMLGLILVATLKCMCQVLNVRRLVVNKDKTALYFYEGENVRGEQILSTLLNTPTASSLKRDGALIINFSLTGQNIGKKCEAVKAFLKKALN